MLRALLLVRLLLSSLSACRLPTQPLSTLDQIVSQLSHGHIVGAAYLPVGRFLDGKHLPPNRMMAIAWAANEMLLEPMEEGAFWRSLQSDEADLRKQITPTVNLTSIRFFGRVRIGLNRDSSQAQQRHWPEPQINNIIVFSIRAGSFCICPLHSRVCHQLQAQHQSRRTAHDPQ